MEKLFQIIKLGEIDKLKELLKPKIFGLKKVDVNAPNRDGLTPLHLAALHGLTEMANLLIDHGADINSVVNLNTTVLHLAVAQGHAETASMLIDRGAEIKVKNRDGQLPIHVAISGGFTETAKMLIDKWTFYYSDSDKDNRTPLHLAALHGHTEIAKILIEKYFDKYNEVDADLPLHIYSLEDNDSNSPIHFAALNGHTEIAKMLIEKGVDVNQTNRRDRKMPLHLAVLGGHMETALMLIRKGADVKALWAVENAVDNRAEFKLELSYFQTIELLLGKIDLGDKSENLVKSIEPPEIIKTHRKKLICPDCGQVGIMENDDLDIQFEVLYNRGSISGGLFITCDFCQKEFHVSKWYKSSVND